MSEVKQEYSVVKWHVPTDFQLESAEEMHIRFGLNGMSTEEIADIWAAYSRRMGAEWLRPNQASVEEVFGVELRPIKESHDEKET